jgi:hypothetical protein
MQMNVPDADAPSTVPMPPETAVPAISTGDTQPVDTSFGSRLGLNHAAGLSIGGFVGEDAALIYILGNAERLLPRHNALGRLALNTTMFGLITAENYAMSRAVNRAVTNSAVRTDTSAESGAERLSAVFGQLDTEQQKRISSIKNPVLRGVRRAMHAVQPLNVIKSVAEKFGDRVSAKGMDISATSDGTLGKGKKAMGTALVELGMVNGFGVPWATLEMMKSGEPMSRWRSLRMSALFAGSWVVGAAVVQGADQVPYVGHAATEGLGDIGKLLDPTHPTDMPLGTGGTLLISSMVGKGVIDSLEATRRLSPDAEEASPSRMGRLLELRNAMYTKLGNHSTANSSVA